MKLDRIKITEYRYIGDPMLTVKEWKEKLKEFPDNARLEFESGYNNIDISVNWLRDETDEEYNQRISAYNRRMIADKQRKQIQQKQRKEDEIKLLEKLAKKHKKTIA